VDFVNGFAKHEEILLHAVVKAGQHTGSYEGGDGNDSGGGLPKVEGGRDCVQLPSGSSAAGGE